MICVIKSERIVKASEYVAKLFPSATYHLVAVVPTIESRHFLTSLYRETMERVAEEAIHEVELVLMQYRVLAIRRKVLRGRPADELLKYITSYPIDLVVITSSVTQGPTPEVVGKVAKRVIAEAPKPILVYTPLSPEPPESIRKLALLVEEGEVWYEAKLLDIVDSIVRGGGEVEALLMCTHYGDLCIRTEEVLKRENVSIEYVHLRGHLEEERLREVIEEVKDYDLLIVGRGSKRLREVRGRKLLRLRSRLSMREHILAGLSPIPVLML